MDASNSLNVIKELSTPLNEFFQTSGSFSAEINGIPTRIRRMSDGYGNFFAIEAISKELSDICGQYIFEKLITQIDYMTAQGKVVIIKAYY